MLECNQIGINGDKGIRQGIKPANELDNFFSNATVSWVRQPFYSALIPMDTSREAVVILIYAKRLKSKHEYSSDRPNSEDQNWEKDIESKPVIELC